MKNTIGRWKGSKVSLELVNELAVTGVIKAFDKSGIILEIDDKQQRYIPMTGVVQVIRKKPAKPKSENKKK